MRTVRRHIYGTTRYSSCPTPTIIVPWVGHPTIDWWDSTMWERALGRFFGMPPGCMLTRQKRNIVPLSFLLRHDQGSEPVRASRLLRWNRQPIEYCLGKVLYGLRVPHVIVDEQSLHETHLYSMEISGLYIKGHIHLSKPQR